MAIVKKLKQHPPLPPSRYEVGIYCRVSTASKTQVVSAGHQLSGLISDVANSQQARLYDVYLDIQSGRTSDNRKNLMRLLDDCRAGRVTLVYTKSISRFARNTVDVLTIMIWSKRTIETIRTNEKYVGDVILYKTFSPNFPEKKRIPNNGEHQKYIQEDHHPAIISRETFRAVQEMRESRSNIERHADGTVTRKARRYTGKKE